MHGCVQYGVISQALTLNTLRLRPDGHHFADDIFTCIFFNENCCIFIKFSLKYVHKGPIDNNRALVQIMAWRRSGDKPLSEPMMISLPTHICVTRPQWVKPLGDFFKMQFYFLKLFVTTVIYQVSSMHSYASSLSWVHSNFKFVFVWGSDHGIHADLS